MRRKIHMNAHGKFGYLPDQKKKPGGDRENRWFWCGLPTIRRPSRRRRKSTTTEFPEENDPESEGESQVIRADNFPIVEVKAFNTNGKEAHFIQINHLILILTHTITGENKTRY